MVQSNANLNIEEYLHQRLTPVAGVVPKLTGLDACTAIQSPLRLPAEICLNT